MVAVPEFPADPALLKTFLWEVALDHFNRVSLTKEDIDKGRQYRMRGLSEELRESSTNLEEFLRGLEMRARVRLLESQDLPRVAQLTQKTNQFNLTTRRYGEPEILVMQQDGRHRIFTLELEDKFGHHGLVGVLIAENLPERETEWKVDTFLLSCRVIGRGAEDFMVAAVGGFLRGLGATRLIGEYVPSAKNAQVAGLYPRLGFSPLPDQERAWVFDLGPEDPPFPDWIKAEQLP